MAKSQLLNATQNEILRRALAFFQYTTSVEGKSLTQKELGSVLGIAQQTVSRFQRGEPAGYDVAEAIARHTQLVRSGALFDRDYDNALAPEVKQWVPPPAVAAKLRRAAEYAATLRANKAREVDATGIDIVSENGRVRPEDLTKLARVGADALKRDDAVEQLVIGGMKLAMAQRAVDSVHAFNTGLSVERLVAAAKAMTQASEGTLAEREVDASDFEPRGSGGGKSSRKRGR